MSFLRPRYHYPKLAGYLLCRDCGARHPQKGFARAGLETQRWADDHVDDHGHTVDFFCRDFNMPGSSIALGWTKWPSGTLERTR